MTVGRTLACLGVAKEEPILLRDSRGTDQVFSQIVIDFKTSLAVPINHNKRQPAAQLMFGRSD